MPQQLQVLKQLVYYLEVMLLLALLEQQKNTMEQLGLLLEV